MDRYVMWRNRDSNAAIDLPSHTVNHNRHVWNTYDWSEKGEEWTKHATNPELWKTTLLERMMFHYIRANSDVLEIGPGAGRWTEYLQQLSKNLILVDIAPKCIEICKERFAGKSNITYHLIKDNIDFLLDKSVDFVWSYDVFVHINPTDTTRYLQNIKRILRPEGIAIIHHSAAEYDSKEIALKGFRSQMTSTMFADLVIANKMQIIEQNRELVHKKGDVITVFTHM